MPIQPPASAVRNPDGSFTWTRSDGVREKNVPHFPLAAIKQVCQMLGTRSFTASTTPGLVALGLTQAQALAVIAGISTGMFYKSMTAIKASGHWQDVYHVPTPPNGTMAYVKFTPVVYVPAPGQSPAAQHIVISFKPH